MQIALQDFFYQSVTYQSGQQLKLYTLKNFQIVDKLVVNEKYSKVIFMVPRIRKPIAVSARKRRSSSLNNSLFSIDSESVTGKEMQEIEEEDRPFINNGMPKIRTFAEASVKPIDHFLVFSLHQTPHVSKDGLIDKIKIDLFVNHTTLFYNRSMISQAETFFH